jgi:arginine N-succinyltransferase
MFLIRQSQPKDVGTLLKLARMVFFINLPPDEQIITDKIAHSARCFKHAAGVAPESGHRATRKRKEPPKGWAEMDSDLFMFTLEDTEAGGVIGTSQVKSHMGGPGNPNWSMQLIEKNFFSKELGQGTTHTVMKLYGDESGPSEVGGLILQPSHRGHRLRPGRFLSFVRFHYIALHRELFAQRVLAEMLGVVSDEGDSAFWDAFGRKFIPVSYVEADRFCQHNRAFISELLPHDELFITLLPLEIQNLVGVVGKETIPARRLLEKLGFANRGFVDPFDGGPHLDAPTDEITLVKSTRRLSLGKATTRANNHGIVSITAKDGSFRAVEVPCLVEGDTVRVSKEAMALLEAKSGAKAGFTPLPAPEGANDAPASTSPTRKRGSSSVSSRSSSRSTSPKRKRGSSLRAAS